MGELQVGRGGMLPGGGRNERTRRHAVEAQRGELVAHQGGQGGDHHRQAFGYQRRKLVAKRLARAGRHHRQHILPRYLLRFNLYL